MTNGTNFEYKGCKCRKQQYCKISLRDRRELHKQFWDMGEFGK